MTAIMSEAGFTGKVDLQVIRNLDTFNDSKPAPLSWKVKNTLTPRYINGWVGAKVAKFVSKRFPVTTITSELDIRKYDFQEAIWIDHGTVGRHVVTTRAAEIIADAFAGTVSPVFIYHALGSGSTAAVVGDTALETEYTTEYLDDNTRATGTQTKEAGSPQVYETVGTNTVDAVPAQAKEHGVVSTATGAASLLDRTVFAEIALSASDAIQSTYRLTIQAGG
jgi:hypothetical protein